MTNKLLKSLALAVPPVRGLYQEVLFRNEEIARLRSNLDAANRERANVNRRIAQLKRNVIWRDRRPRGDAAIGRAH